MNESKQRNYFFLKHVNSNHLFISLFICMRMAMAEWTKARMILYTGKPSTRTRTTWMGKKNTRKGDDEKNDVVVFYSAKYNRQ